MRDYKPKGAPTIIPSVTVSDVEKAIDFYTKAFGFKASSALMKQGDQVAYAELDFADGRIMVFREGAYDMKSKTPSHSGQQPPMSLYIYCQDVDAHHKQAVAAGAQQMHPLEDMFWGDRMYMVADPDGHHWTFAQNVADFDPSKVPS
ncbi:MAG: VOC family protein [Myxococcota bacterium]